MLRTCQHCRREFEGRSDADHCSDRCRARAARERKKDQARRLQSLVATLAKEAGLRPEDLG